MNLEFHPVANIFPLLQGDEFEALKADVEANGLIEPIWLHPDGRIIDGRNRYRACNESGTEPKFEIYQGGLSGVELLTFVMSLNYHRRHLSSSQLAACSLDAKELIEEEIREQESLRKQNQNNSTFQFFEKSSPRNSTEEVASLFNTNRQYVSDAKKLKQESPDLFEQVKAGEMTIPQAKKKIPRRHASPLPPNGTNGIHLPEPKPILEQVISQVDGCKIVLGDAKKLDLTQFEQYGVIVADPPWPYRITIKQGTTEGQYDTMTDEDLRAIPVSQLALPDSVLLLWGTWPKLPEALALLEAWGFDYVTGFPWVKSTSGNNIDYGVGYWIRGVSEYVMIGKRGGVSVESLRLKGFMGLLAENGSGSPELWLGGPNLQHSRKPDSVHQIAEALPGPYLELFGRRPRHGWTVFGNDIALSQKTLA